MNPSEDEDIKEIQEDLSWGLTEKLVNSMVKELAEMQILDDPSRIATMVATGSLLITQAFDFLDYLNQPQVIHHLLPEIIKKISERGLAVMNKKPIDCSTGS